MSGPRRIRTQADLSKVLQELFERVDGGYTAVAAHAQVSTAALHAMITGRSFPRWSTLQRVVIALGVAQDALPDWQAAHRRAGRDRLAAGLGWPLTTVSDPFRFDLEVHPAIDIPAGTVISDLPALPAYVAREHDRALAEVVTRAAAGDSRIVVLVGGSSTGKTRACWEALHPLRARQESWRLWHPIELSHGETALADMARISPHTVVWLNEAQRYLADPERGERVAAVLRELLRDARRAPVLVLSTLWPQYWDTLTSRAEPDLHAQARELLAGSDIEVPAAFTGADLDVLAAQAGQDARLSEAAGRARDGRITQYLAGVPQLMSRYRNAPPAAKALIHAAMDARRLGCGPHLPQALLAEAAPSYLSDTEWEDLDGTRWLAEALAYLTRPCSGIPGILTPVTPRPSLRHRPDHDCRDAVQPAGAQTELLYRLADYLDQHGSGHRADLLPPSGFWIAAARHAAPSDLGPLGRAARARGLYRDAAQLWKNATRHGDPRAAADLVEHMSAFDVDGVRAARWAATHAALDDPEAVSDLLDNLREAGAWRSIAMLLARDPAGHAALDYAAYVADLLAMLHQVGAHDQVAKLAHRAASGVAIDHLWATGGLLRTLREVGAEAQLAALADRTAAHCPLDEVIAVVELLEALRRVGAEEQLTELADRAAACASLDEPYDVAKLLIGLHELGATGPLTALLARDPAAHTPPDHPDAIRRLWYALRYVKANRHARALADRAAAHVAVNNPHAVVDLLHTLRDARANKAIGTLLARNPAAHVALASARSVAELLEELRKARAAEQAAVLASRAAGHVAVDDLYGVAMLLASLRSMGADEHATTLAARAAAVPVPVDDPQTVDTLLRRLQHAGACELITVLLARDPAGQVRLDTMSAVTWLLTTLHAMRETVQVTRLAGRAAAQVPVDDPQAVAMLLTDLHTIRADDHIETLLARDPATHASLSRPDAVANLLISLRQLDHVEAQAHVATLASRAANVAVSDPKAVVKLMVTLHSLEAGEQLRTLADRAATHAALDDPSAATWLLRALRELKAHRQVAVLTDRLCAAGHFQSCLQQDHKDSFAFGRQPDGGPAPAWSWHDLE